MLPEKTQKTLVKSVHLKSANRTTYGEKWPNEENVGRNAHFYNNTRVTLFVRYTPHTLRFFVYANAPVSLV
jgi:hypothetical protein